MEVFQKLLDLYLRFPWKLEAARTHLGDLKPFFPRERRGGGVGAWQWYPYIDPS